MIKRILVGLADKPSAQVATRRAINLAKLHDAEIAGVAIIDTSALESIGPTPLGAAQQARQLRAHRREMTREHVEEALTRFKVLCEDAGVPYEVRREEGKPLEQIVKLSRYYDLVILNLHDLFDYGVVTEPDETVLKLIRSGVRPILACVDGHEDINRIMIAYNGSVESAKAMRRLIHLQFWPGAEFKIVCFELPRDEARVLLDEAARYCRAHSVTPELEYVGGTARDRLLPTAQAWGADLIAIGASTRRPLLHRLVGDVPHTLMKHSDRHLFLAQ